MRNTFGLSLVFCLAFGLTDVACKTAVASIDKSTVEAGRVHIKGTIDTAQDLVVRIDRGGKPIEWRSSRTGGGEFEVIVEASDKIRLEDGKTGHGFVVTTKILTSSNINYVHCAGDLAGTFAIRREADFVTRDGVLTFADVTLKEGKKLPVSLRLALSQTAGPARAKAVEDKVVEAITALGGTVTRDEHAAGRPVIGVSLEHTGVTNEGLKELKELKHLQSLNLNRCYRITDPALKEIAELKSLRSLDLGFTGLQQDTGGNADHLGENILVSLVFRQGLGIPRTDCTGITNEGLAHLKQLENLQSLDLDSTQISDAGLAELKTLKNLQTLVIGYNEKMTGTGLAELKDLKNLQHLDLIHSSITDEGAKFLVELQSLKTIDLRGTQITDAGLKELQSLRNLKELNLCLVPRGPFDVTREGIVELQAALPEANVLR